MKLTAILAALAAATVVNAQGYNSTSRPASSSHPAAQVSVYDSRTVNVPKPSAPPTTALTSYHTFTSTCGTIQILVRSTAVYPLNSGTATRTASIFTGTSSAGAARTGAAMLAGAGGLLAALAL